ncbi:MAG: SpoIIE family protein phosphatase [Acidobacteria bacterium]|nr:SpoIIE family protein phosphatase [Acidobacteriota bacterium]
MPEETILVVDDEIANLQKLQRTLINRYSVLTASSGYEALNLVRQNDSIAVMIVDQRMPDMTGVDFLRQTLDIAPHAVRIILTGFTDADVLMEAINSCKVYRYIVKPWDPPDLLITVERGLEAHRLARENEQFRKELIRRERLARELEIAGEIQRYILPPHCPGIDGYEMSVEYHPAREVGGDLYDFEYGAGLLQIVIGDVSGKSIPAALYGAVFSGQLRTLFSGMPAPAKALRLLNENLLARYQSNNYIAVAYCRIDLASGTGILANGGMPFPFLDQDGSLTRLEVRGVPLGLMEVTDYEELEFRMHPGDTLVLASDGVMDAQEANGEFYGERRFADSIRQNSGKEVPDFLKCVHSDVCRFINGSELSDDITTIALRRKR